MIQGASRWRTWTDHQTERWKGRAGGAGGGSCSFRHGVGRLRGTTSKATARDETEDSSTGSASELQRDQGGYVEHDERKGADGGAWHGRAR